MARDKLVQFRIPNTQLSYSIKLYYDDYDILETVERQSIRRQDRNVLYRMLNETEKDAFLTHFNAKMSSLPITRG